MLVGYGIEEPLDILFGTDDARQAEDLNGGIVGVDTHVHAILLTGGHDGFKEVLHVGTQLGLVDTLVEVEEVAELLDGRFVVLAEVAGDEALCLDDDGLHELMVLLWRHRLCQFVALCQ